MKGKELIRFILDKNLENFEFPQLEDGEIEINHTRSECYGSNYSGGTEVMDAISYMEQARDKIEDAISSLGS